MMKIGLIATAIIGIVMAPTIATFLLFSLFPFVSRLSPAGTDGFLLGG
jgi:hypothetical protein